MIERRVPLAAALLWAACGCAWGGEPLQLRLRWDELRPRITNRKVAFVLADGTRAEGKVMAVTPDGLRLKISKSSNRKTQPKGKQLVARQALPVLRVTEYRKLGRLLGTIGAIGIATGIVLAQSIDLYEGPAVILVPALTATGVIGVGIGGYYTGKLFDKRVTEISIVPEPKPADEAPQFLVTPTGGLR